MSIFEIIISPFIFIIEKLFLISYDLTNDYGISIILLSLGISLLLFPIFILIEKVKKKNDAIKLKMKPLADEIKRCYKGQERYYYLRTLNRQHNFNPLKALFPILSLLLQIPFFIAAYQFLENFEPLKGNSFLFINDLAQPDGLFGKIHFLPIAMTLINLITAYFYTRHGNTSERKQMLIVAGIFLVLLFNLPSGLVLYWTMNNIFSFFRLFVTNPEVFKKSDRETSKLNLPSFDYFRNRFVKLFSNLKYLLLAILGLAIISQLNWAMHHNFDDIFIRIPFAILASFLILTIVLFTIILLEFYKETFSKIQVKPLLALSLFLLTIYFFVSAKYFYDSINFDLAKIAAVLTLAIQLIGILYFLRMRNKTNIWLYIFSVTIITLIFITQFINLIVIIEDKQLALKLLNINIGVNNSSSLNFAKSGIIFTLITIPYYWSYYRIKLQSSKVKYNWLIFLLSALFIIGLIFFWNPLISYSSYPGIFNFPAKNILLTNSNLFLISFGIAIFIYLITPKILKRLLLIGLLSITIIAFVNSVLLPIKLGTLQENVFSDHKNLASPLYVYLLEALFIVGVVLGTIFLFRKKLFKTTVAALVLLNIAIIGQSLYSAIDTGVFFKKVDRIKTNTSTLKDGAIMFSKNEQNVVVFMLDGYQGWYLKQILTETPSLNKSLEGFVWYPNSLSISNFTHSSVPAIMSGYDFDVMNLEADSSHTIEEKITKASQLFVQKVKNKGYNLMSSKMHHSKVNINEYDAYLPPWHESWSEKLNSGITNEIWYTRLWENALLYSAPICIKPRIYNNSKWLMNAEMSDNSSESGVNINSITQKYYSLKLLPDISFVSENKGSFVYIHSMVPHIPFNIIDSEGKFTKDVSPYENNKWTLMVLNKWFEWMKANGVYDNTKIILVSDHGPSWDIFDGDMHIDYEIPDDKNEPKKVSKKEFWRQNILLMVKDYNTKGELNQDWRLMSNADIPAIAFDEDDPTKIDSTSRVLTTSISWWSTTILKDKKFKLYKHFEVKDNMYDLNNWRSIEIQ